MRLSRGGLFLIVIMVSDVATGTSRGREGLLAPTATLCGNAARMRKRPSAMNDIPEFET